jgi:hypothetical protein
MNLKEVNKVLGGRLQKRESRNVIIDVFLEHETYSNFKAYQAKRGLDENGALVEVLERGMANYWLQEFKNLKQSYPSMERMFKEYKKDNEVLRALEQQNKRLKGILEEKANGEKSSLSINDHEAKT